MLGVFYNDHNRIKNNSTNDEVFRNRNSFVIRLIFIHFYVIHFTFIFYLLSLIIIIFKIYIVKDIGEAWKKMERKDGADEAVKSVRKGRRLDCRLNHRQSSLSETITLTPANLKSFSSARFLLHIFSKLELLLSGPHIPL